MNTTNKILGVEKEVKNYWLELLFNYTPTKSHFRDLFHLGIPYDDIESIKSFLIPNIFSPMNYKR